jgi:hypothetical protein
MGGPHRRFRGYPLQVTNLAVVGNPSLYRFVNALSVPPLGMQALNRKDHYQHMAGQCLKLAQNSDDPTNKALLLEMAQSWVKLAEMARDSEVDGSSSDRDS